LRSGSKNENTCPRLTLERDKADPTCYHLHFEPDPRHWYFDNARGTREQLQREISTVVQRTLNEQTYDALFDDGVQRALRVQVMLRLLHWVANRGLRIAAGA
jgi:hypothetical protein